MSSPTGQIYLKRREDLRIRNGHPWVFSNEIQETRGTPRVGDIVELRAAGGQLLGIGFWNPHSLIAFRFLHSVHTEISAEFFSQRIANAETLRRKLFPGSAVYRLIHGEADFLPGLVIDRYNDLFVVQTFAAGMDMRLDIICDALESLYQPRGIIERNESPLRQLEELPLLTRVRRGSSSPTEFTEDGVTFLIDPLQGQKTGFFLDQRVNRKAILSLAGGAGVLDCFCNDGGFSLYACAGGAASVIGVDASHEAIQRAQTNAPRNGFTQARFVCADVFDFLKDAASREEHFDLVVLDPPSFTKSKKNVTTARKGYRDLHGFAFRVLRRNGILLTTSCSHHIIPEAFLETIHQAAIRAGRSLQLLDWRGASPDHPTLPMVPETRYLKFGIFRVS
jgi:23S rRNA (cytosine1962-C5)-methyltransferase